MRKIVHAARRAPVIAAAHYEGNVQIWNFDSGEKLSEFNTVLDGCSRLGISSTGEFLVAANWANGKNAGIACYETSSGVTVWHRTDLQHVQSTRFGEHGDWIWCKVEGKSAHCLDAKTGDTLTAWDTVQEVLESPHSSHVFLSRRTDFIFGTQAKQTAVSWLHGTGGKVAFSPGAVYVCEYGNPTIRPVVTIRGHIRCFESETGNERWRHQLPDGHFMQLISYQADGFIYGVLSGNENNAWVVTIVRFSTASGACTEISRLKSPPPYFGGFGDGVLVTPDGDVVSLQTGAIIRHLQFGEEQVATSSL
jgi:outer membrane protein assembly factor BamB